MSQAEKRLARMRANRKGWRFDDLKSILEGRGFLQAPTSGGSHRVFTHHSGVTITLVDKGSGAVLPVYVTNVLKAIDEVGRK